MTKPNTDGGYILPTIVDPPRRCLTLEIPDEPQHAAAFFGALLTLGYWYNWQRDSGHTAKDVAAVWFDVFNKACEAWIAGCPDCPPFEGIFIEDDMPQFRQEGCLLQVQCATGEWETVYDPTACIQAGGVQPSPQPPPAAGQCTTFHATLSGAGKYLLPTVVNAGDQINVSAVSGAWNDGALFWYCPNGGLSGPLGCTGSTSPGTGDPLPTASHMRLIMNIDGVFYDGYNTLMTVPAGVVDGQVFFQANDADITDNAGSVLFDVEVCAKPPAARWTHTFDFASNGQQGWTINVPSGADPDGPTGVFSPDGFHSLPWHSTAFAEYYNYISVSRIYSADGTIDQVDVYYSNSTDGSTASVNAVDSDGADFYVWPYQTGGPFHMSHTGTISATAGNQALVDLGGSHQASGPVGGEVVFTKIVFQGPGTDPF